MSYISIVCLDPIGDVVAFCTLDNSPPSHQKQTSEEWQAWFSNAYPGKLGDSVTNSLFLTS